MSEEHVSSKWRRLQNLKVISLKFMLLLFILFITFHFFNGKGCFKIPKVLRLAIILLSSFYSDDFSLKNGVSFILTTLFSVF